MKGHAGAGKKGEDLVCASASILSATLAENVRILEKAGVAKNVNIIQEEGEVLVSCSPVEEKDTLLCVYETIITGFMMLHENFPKYLKFIEK